MVVLSDTYRDSSHFTKRKEGMWIISLQYIRNLIIINKISTKPVKLYIKGFKAFRKYSYQSGTKIDDVETYKIKKYLFLNEFDALKMHMAMKNMNCLCLICNILLYVRANIFIVFYISCIKLGFFVTKIVQQNHFKI